MDQFFAAVEERERPDIRGKPVVVGADPKDGKGRGVVSTCNYEARKYGVKSGMAISVAWSLVPWAVYLPVNYRLYQKVSARIMSILRCYADKFEQWGLDEAFLDVTSQVKTFEDAKIVARKIKKEIREKETLICSVGVGSNKLIAKVASDFEKPDGLTVVKSDGAKAFLAPLRVRKLLWVGKKTELRLNRLGIKTIGDLAKFDASILVERFGAAGTQLYLLAQGIDNSEVHERRERKSMSREITFEEDISDLALILETLDAISEDLHQELSASKFTFKTITVKIRYENFETHTHAKTLVFFTDRRRDIMKSARDLVQDFLIHKRKIRLIGVRLSNLSSLKHFPVRLNEYQPI
jgi:DNA polymerase IV (DinB-like DNA polymerase)